MHLATAAVYLTDGSIFATPYGTISVLGTLLQVSNLDPVSC